MDAKRVIKLILAEMALYEENPNDDAARKEAHAKGLKYKGYGVWANTAGEPVAKTINGKLVMNPQGTEPQSSVPAAPAAPTNMFSKQPQQQTFPPAVPPLNNVPSTDKPKKPRKVDPIALANKRQAFASKQYKKGRKERARVAAAAKLRAQEFDHIVDNSLQNDAVLNAIGTAYVESNRGEHNYHPDDDFDKLRNKGYENAYDAFNNASPEAKKKIAELGPEKFQAVLAKAVEHPDFATRLANGDTEAVNKFFAPNEEDAYYDAKAKEAEGEDEYDRMTRDSSQDYDPEYEMGKAEFQSDFGRDK